MTKSEQIKKLKKAIAVLPDESPALPELEKLLLDLDPSIRPDVPCILDCDGKQFLAMSLGRIGISKQSGPIWNLNEFQKIHFELTSGVVSKEKFILFSGPGRIQMITLPDNSK